MNIDFKKYPYPERLRHHTTPYNYIPLKELNGLPDYYPPIIEKADWSKIFINAKQPDVLDVGCAKANLLLNYAENNPNSNILGIEVRVQLTEWLENLIKSENIPNAGVIWYTIVNGLDFIEAASISKIFYLFPDPWTKQRHKKRRAYNADTLEEYRKVLKIGGELYLATDIEEVHNDHLKLLNRNGGFDIEIIESDERWGLPQTNKEKFCRRVSIPFYRIIAHKK